MWISLANAGFNKRLNNVQKYCKSLGLDINSKNVLKIQYKNYHSYITKNLRSEYNDLKYDCIFQINNFKNCEY